MLAQLSPGDLELFQENYGALLQSQRLKQQIVIYIAKYGLNVFQVLGKNEKRQGKNGENKWKKVKK